MLQFILIFRPAPAQNVTPVHNEDGTYGFKVGNMYLEIDPDYGGRITSMKLDSQEIMYVNKSGDYWGGSFWLSPQSEFWPPSQVLDAQPYSGGFIGNSVSILSGLDSGYDPPLMYRKTFSANLADTSISITFSIINKGSASHKYSAWQLTRVPTGGMAFFPIGMGDPTGGLALYVQVMNNVVWYKYTSSDAPGNKYYVDGSQGWDAWVSDSNVLFVREFKDVPGDMQAPGEAEAELWLNGPSSYIELEIQSEYANIDPGDSLVWNMKWYLRKLPGDVLNDIGSNSLISYTKSLLEGTAAIHNTENSGSNSFTLSPNPCIDLLSVHVSPVSDRTLKLFIYNLQGTLIFEHAILSEEARFHLGSLPSGIYIYKIAGRLNIYRKAHSGQMTKTYTEKGVFQ